MPLKRKPISVHHVKIMQKTRRKQMLRKKMQTERIDSCQRNFVSHPHPVSTKVKMGHSKNLMQKSLNFQISFNASVSDDGNRTVKALTFANTTCDQDQMLAKSTKQWPKSVCHLEILSLHSYDSIMDGSMRYQNVDITKPIKPPVNLLPRISTKAPIQLKSLISTPSNSPSTPEKQVLLSSPRSTISQNIIQTNNAKYTLPTQIPRRLVLSDQPPPMFKVPYMTVCKMTADLRPKIKGNVPPMEVLKTFNDDTISICAPNEIGYISDGDILCTSGENPPLAATIISHTKNADIANWLNKSLTSLKPNPQPEKSDPPDTVIKDSISIETSTPQNECNSTVQINTSLSSQKPSSVVSDDKQEVKRSLSETAEMRRIECDNQPNTPSDSNKATLNISTSPERQCSNNPIEEYSQQNLNQRPDTLPNASNENDNQSCISLHNRNTNFNIIASNQTYQSSPQKIFTPPDSNLPIQNQLISQGPPVLNFMQPAIYQHQIDSRYYRPLFNECTARQKWIRFGCPNPRFSPLHYQQPIRNYRPPSSQKCVYRRMRPRGKEALVAEFNPNVPPPIINKKIWRPEIENHEQIPEEQRDLNTFHSPRALMQLNEIHEYLARVCPSHYRGDVCNLGSECGHYHKCSEEFRLGIEAMNAKDLKTIVTKICQDRKYSLICEILDNLLQTYILRKDRQSILDLVHPVLQVDYLRYTKVQTILQALCRLNMPYKDAAIKILHYLGASNQKLVDILFSITIENFTPSTSLSVWPAIEQLLDLAAVVDYGVFSDLCTKCLYVADRAILNVLAQTLLADPCQVEVDRMECRLLVNLCNHMEQVGGMGEVARQVKRRWAEAGGSADVDERIGNSSNRIAVLDGDAQLATISSTLPGYSNVNFNSAPHGIQNPSTTAYVHAHAMKDIELRKNSCSPDSSSYAAVNPQKCVQQQDASHRFTISSSSSTSIAHPLPVPTLLPVIHPSRTQSIRIQPSPPTYNNNASGDINTLSPFSTEQSSPRSVVTNSPYSTIATHSRKSMLTVDHNYSHLRLSILKSQHNNVAALIAKEREASVVMICKIVNDKEVPVQVAFAFFADLWDHIAEHSLQYGELRTVVMYILFNIYEFLLKEDFSNEAALLLTDKFSNNEFKYSFLTYKTYLPSGQCSPTQKCHKVVKLLLKEKMLSACFEWFIRNEYQNVTLPSDLNNRAFVEEKNNLVEEFLTLSYRELDIALNLIFFCIDRRLGDFRKHYNGIVIQMINGTDFKERIIAHKERFYNDEYVYLSTPTLRSYIVEFYPHLTLNELLHLYDIISRDEVYPKLTGYDDNIALRNTLKEAEIILIFTMFLYKIKQHHIEVTWNVQVQFYEETTSIESNRTQTIPVYPRNLLMCGTVEGAAKRLVSVLKGCSFLKNDPVNMKWRASYKSGVVTLFGDHIQDMVKNYRGIETFT